MERRTSALARIIAAVALAGAAVVVIVAIASSVGDSGEATKSRTQPTHKSRPKTKAKTYVVESGDTLVSIAHRTGIPLKRILALNPGVDPQLLSTGETLKLR